MAKNAGTNGLDIQRNYICVATYDPQSVSVRQVAVHPVPVEDGAARDVFWGAVSKALKGIRKKIRFAGAPVVCSLPCDMAVVRAFEADSDEFDQDKALRWELETNLPAPVAEYTFGFYEVDPGNQIDRRRYVAAALRREALVKLRKALKSVNLDPYIVDIDLFALTNVFRSNYNERMSEASVLVHGEFGRTKMILVYNSSYIDCKVVDFGAEERGAEAYAAMLREETARLVAGAAGFFPQAHGAAVYLSGALFTELAFAESVMAGVTRCEMLDPFRNVACVAGMDAEQLKTYRAQLAVAVGLALRGEEGA